MLVAAAEEERFTRTKHDSRFPALAIEYCLREAGISLRDVSHAGFYWQPWKGLLKRVWWLVRYFPASLQTFRGGKPWRGSVGTLLKHLAVPFRLWRRGFAAGSTSSTTTCRMPPARFSFAVRVGGDPDRRSVRRGLHDAARPRRRQSDRSAAALLPAALARDLLRSAHAVLGYEPTPTNTRSWGWLRTASRDSAIRSRQ